MNALNVLTRLTRVPVFNTPFKRMMGRKFSTKPFDVAVIGAGAAGMSAAIHGRFDGLNVAVFEGRRLRGGSFSNTPIINNLPGYPLGISGASLSESTIQQFQKLGGSFFPERLIKKISKKETCFILHAESGDSYQAKTIILATGVAYRKLDLPKVRELEQKGIYYEVDDSICDKIIQEKIPIYIYGGGNSAGQAAVFYRSLGARVVLINRNDSLNKTMSQCLIDRMDGLGCEIIPNTSITAVEGEQALTSIETTHLELNKKNQFATNHLFVLIGGIPAPLPEVDFDSLALDERGYVKVEGFTTQRMISFATSINRIFAAGDITHIGAGRIQLAQAQGVQAIMQATYWIQKAKLSDSLHMEKE